MAWRQSKEIKTINSYFIADRNLLPRQLKATYLGTNITFTNILIALAAYSYLNGIKTFWILIWWLAGMGFFYWIFPKISWFFKKGQTLHEFLGESYNSYKLRRIASLATVTIFIGTIGLELYGGQLLLMKLGFLDKTYSITIALFIALILVVYTVLGGFKITVRTDIIQIVLIGISLAIIVYALITFSPNINTNPQINQSNPFSIKNLFIDPIWIISMLFLFFPFQLCVMDMWQRCTAVGGKVGFIKNMLKIDSLGFIVAYSIPVVMGIFVSISGLKLENENDAFFAVLINGIGPIFIGLVYVGLFAAMLSTADTLLICAAHSLVRDTWATLKNLNLDNLSDEQENKLVISVRLWTVVVGLASVSIMFLFNFFSLYELIIAVFSAQIIFFIPILFAIFKPKFCSKRSLSPRLSILVGLFIPIITIIIGKYVINDKVVIDSAPIVGFIISSIVFFSFLPVKNISSQKRKNNLQNGGTEC